MQRHGRRCAAINLPKWEITGASGVRVGGEIIIKKKKKKTYGQRQYKKRGQNIFGPRTTEGSKSAKTHVLWLWCCEVTVLTATPPLDMCTVKVYQLPHLKKQAKKKKKRFFTLFTSVHSRMKERTCSCSFFLLFFLISVNLYTIVHTEVLSAGTWRDTVPTHRVRVTAVCCVCKYLSWGKVLIV